jgi:carbamoyltransferase
MRRILGISAFYHDSAAALVVDGEIVAAAQEERFTRRKNDESFPKNAIQFCLEHAKLRLDQLDAVVFYDKPVLKFSRALETFLAVAPRGWLMFVRALPGWFGENHRRRTRPAQKRAHTLHRASSGACGQRVLSVAL